MIEWDSLGTLGTNVDGLKPEGASPTTGGGPSTTLPTVPERRCGFVVVEESGRWHSCGTVLSRYNSTARCWVHREVVRRDKLSRIRKTSRRPFTIVVDCSDVDEFARRHPEMREAFEAGLEEEDRMQMRRRK